MKCNLVKEAVVVNNASLEKEDALTGIISKVCESYKISGFEEVYKSVIEREGKLSTGIGLGVAVPHCRIYGIDQIVAGVMLAPKGIDFNSVDGHPVKLIFLIISPMSEIQGHIACLSSISHLVSDEETRQLLISSKNSDELFQIINERMK